MELRRLVLDDLEHAYANRLRALEQAPDAFLTSLEEERARGTVRYERVLREQHDDNVIFGAVDAERVVATAGIVRDAHAKARHKALIWGVWVDVDQRSRGLGGQVLDLAIDHARRSPGVVTVQLSVSAGNDGARRLYESRGFRRWGVEPRATLASAGYLDEEHMVLDLA